MAGGHSNRDRVKPDLIWALRHRTKQCGRRQGNGTFSASDEQGFLNFVRHLPVTFRSDSTTKPRLTRGQAVNRDPL
jgi:hypothetical protein